MKQYFLNKTSKGKQYLIATILVLLVSALCFVLSGFMGYRVIAFILLVTVSIIASLFDIFPVLLAALLSALIWNFFFIPPRFTFHIDLSEDVIMFLMYFLIASVSATLTYKIRQISKIAREEEEKANTVKLYNALLNSLSHELRTPIATIIGAADNVLNDKNKLTEQNKRELVSEISEASLRLNRQVENLLNMSRLESGFLKAKKDWCDVNELVHSTINQLDDVLKKHIVRTAFDSELPLVKLDFGLMQQTLNNLLTNAAVYTPEGSTILINVNIYKKGTSETLFISVDDNGKGFPTNEMGLVFEKFYRLKNSKAGGTGLGLSIVKGFVEAHNGNITVANNKAGGASFTIEIPAETSYLNNQKNE